MYSVSRNRTHRSPPFHLHLYPLRYTLRSLLWLPYSLSTTSSFHPRSMWPGLYRCRNWYIPRNSFSIYSKQDILGKHGEEQEWTGDTREVCENWLNETRSDYYHFCESSRLHMAILGGVLAPIGLWWFAWWANDHSNEIRINEKMKKINL